MLNSDAFFKFHFNKNACNINIVFKKSKIREDETIDNDRSKI